MGDEIADGLFDQAPGSRFPLALFDAARVDYSLRRLVHYTGSDWRHVQRWVLLTNYHRYIDQFVRIAAGHLTKGTGKFDGLVMPGNISIARGVSPEQAQAKIATSVWHRYQMPAYHLTAPGGEGVTLINIGVGPSNAKNITDHLAVLRPHCWLMVGHCGGLRGSQSIGDYVLAHAYLRQDRILDALVPPDVPIPALAEVQVALQEAAEKVTGRPRRRAEAAASHGHCGDERRPELGATLYSGEAPDQPVACHRRRHGDRGISCRDISAREGVVVRAVVGGEFFETHDPVDNAVDGLVHRLRCQVVEHQHGRAELCEKVLQRQNLSPIAQGVLRQQADFGQAVEDDTLRFHSLDDLVENHLCRFAELKVRRIEQALLTCRDPAGFRAGRARRLQSCRQCPSRETQAPARSSLLSFPKG